VNKAKELRKLERQLDKMWHDAVVKKFGGVCVLTGSTEKLNAHHVVTRRNKWGRWFIPNGLLLSPSAHKFSVRISAHQAPTNLVFWLWSHSFFSDNYATFRWMGQIYDQTDRPKGPIDYEAVKRHLQGKQEGY